MTGAPQRMRTKPALRHAACTVSAMLCVEETPSPLAVTVMREEPKVALAEPVNVNVSVAFEEAGSGFADHAAVTPAGKPEIENATLPANEPPVATDSPTAAEFGSAKVMELVATVRVSDGGSLSAAQSSASTAPSTEPSPVAKL